MPLEPPQRFLCDLPGDMPEITRELTHALPRDLANIVVDYWNPWRGIYDRNVLTSLRGVIKKYGKIEAGSHIEEPWNPDWRTTFRANAMFCIELFEEKRRIIRFYGSRRYHKECYPPGQRGMSAFTRHLSACLQKITSPSIISPPSIPGPPVTYATIAPTATFIAR